MAKSDGADSELSFDRDDVTDERAHSSVGSGEAERACFFLVLRGWLRSPDSQPI
jgi:hypothetical protein